MKLMPSEDWSRKLFAAGIPTEHPKDLTDMLIVINYASDSETGDCHKAVALDGKVIPLITKSVNCHDRLVKSLSEMVEMFERHISGKPGPDDAARRWDDARNILAEAKKQLP